VENRKKVKDKSLKRVYRKTILLNKRELQAINHYCDKYKIKNKSKFIRETIILSILKKFDEDYPSLFEQKPTLFNQHLNNR
jgi:ABC-type dipeptide/oligopeptide/nickel transport system ATPase subunit